MNDVTSRQPINDVIKHMTEKQKDDAITLAKSILADRHRVGTSIQTPDDLRSYLQLHFSDRKNEEFGVVFLNTRYQILAHKTLFYGTINGASVHARPIVQEALEHNASALIIFHNHPSGVAEPSQADITVTRRIKDACALMDITVLDHFVVCVDDITSFAERGLL